MSRISIWTNQEELPGWKCMPAMNWTQTILTIQKQYKLAQTSGLLLGLDFKNVSKNYEWV